ncbi:beta-ketoacyl synthase chain length factor [Chitinophaga pollutisoli]|uniref:Beta-ketoacyl synthase chain length factor n=1 Tax=Chitinophaga pollutisoli TaxID=3133966 RepID=A0ABZ2YKR0_9BACT
MRAFIQGAGCVSAQDSSVFPGEIRQYEGDRLPVADPDYKQWIDIKQIRRMGRAIKMGVAASHMSLETAGIKNPDAIVMGTAYGCLADTGVFLQKLVSQHEDMLTPTAFIQSTHNTVAGQIALLLGCHAYNNTFVHGAFSFENALQDGLLLLAENPSRQILAGATDEITGYSHTILRRFGLYRHAVAAGEGAAFFVLSAEKKDTSLAQLTAVEMLYRPASEKETADQLAAFLARSGVQPGGLNLVLTGRNGDEDNDKYYETLESSLFQDTPIAAFKQFCGEYPTASAFAVWMAAGCLNRGAVPQEAMVKGAAPAQPERILIWNHHQGKYHSFILLEKC